MCFVFIATLSVYRKSYENGIKYLSTPLVKIMSTEITPQQLIAVNLRYGTTAKSLKTLAFSDLSAKALFHSSRALSIKDVGKKVAELTGISAVSEDLIKNGLEELRTDRRVNLTNGKWESLIVELQKIA